MKNIVSQQNHFLLKIYILIALTTSFDVFLMFPVGGFSVRFAQLLLFIPVFYLIGQVLSSGRIKIPLGGRSLLIWTFFIFLFIPHTSFLSRNIGYAFWMILNVFLIFSMVSHINSYHLIMKFTKWYINSFFFVALFGLLQFALGVVGISPPLVTQWWSFGSLPRINGFSYEPSFFATYILIGWVLTFQLWISSQKFYPKRKLFFILITLTIAMILSSSRMGILLMLIFSSRFIYLFVQYLIQGKLHIKYFSITAIIFFTFTLGTTLFIINLDKLNFLLIGTGLNGTPAHSVEDRSNNSENMLTAFKESPIYGYSLGGVSPAVGKLSGVTVVSNERAKDFESGGSTTLEILAASGVFGFLFYLSYIALLIFSPLYLRRKIKDNNLRSILQALVFALVCELIILQLNQNILRQYLWMHIAFLSSVYSFAKKHREDFETADLK